MKNSLKNQLKEMLSWEAAHANTESALKDVPFEAIGIKPEGVEYSIWQLAEHIRITQNDILKFCTDQHYQEMTWPDDYWPESPAPKSIKDLNDTIHRIKADRKKFVDHLSGAEDLFSPIPWGSGQNLFREAVLVIDHTAYHTGQIILIRKLLGIW